MSKKSLTTILITVLSITGLVVIMKPSTTNSSQDLSLTGRMAWPAVLKMVRSNFPDVSQIPADTLSAWLAEEDNKPILLDVRAAEEYAVSHLKDARLTPSEKEAAALLADTPIDRRIVVYCSVGYRSSELAEQLMKAGYTNVHNLEGSLFVWANEGRPVYREDREVDKVHPYDGTWGKLLKKALRWKKSD